MEVDIGAAETTADHQKTAETVCDSNIRVTITKINSTADSNPMHEVDSLDNLFRQNQTLVDLPDHSIAVTPSTLRAAALIGDCF